MKAQHKGIMGQVMVVLAQYGSDVASFPRHSGTVGICFLSSKEWAVLIYTVAVQPSGLSYKFFDFRCNTNWIQGSHFVFYLHPKGIL